MSIFFYFSKILEMKNTSFLYSLFICFSLISLLFGVEGNLFAQKLPKLPKKIQLKKVEPRYKYPKTRPANPAELPSQTPVKSAQTSSLQRNLTVSVTAQVPTFSLPPIENFDRLFENLKWEERPVFFRTQYPQGVFFRANRRTLSQINLALHFYRDELKNYPKLLADLNSKKRLYTILGGYSQKGTPLATQAENILHALCDITAMAFLGSASDRQLLLDIFSAVKGKEAEDVFAAAITRTLLAWGDVKGLQELINLATNKKVLKGVWWNELQNYLQTYPIKGITYPFVAPVSTKTTLPANLLKQAGFLPSIHASYAPQMTHNFLETVKRFRTANKRHLERLTNVIGEYDNRGLAWMDKNLPDWESDISAGYASAFGLNAADIAALTLRQSLKETDRIFFENPQSQSWNYAAEFEEIFLNAMQKNIPLPTGKIQTLSRRILNGGNGAPWSVRPYLTLLTLQAREAAGLAFPKAGFSVNGRNLKPEEMTPEQKEEYLLAKRVFRGIEDKKLPRALVDELTAFRENGRVKHAHQTPQELREELKLFIAKYHHYPKEYFYKNGVRLEAGEYSQAQQAESNLALRLRWTMREGNPADKDIIYIKNQYVAQRTISDKKSPEQLLEELQVWLAEHNNVYPTSTQNKALNSSITHAIKVGDPSDPAIAELIRLKETYRAPVVATRTQEQVLSETKEWVDTHNKLPSAYSEDATEKSLAIAVRNLLAKHKKSPTAISEELFNFVQSHRTRSAIKTTEDWLDEFAGYLLEHQSYPPAKSALYRGIFAQLKNGAKQDNGLYVSATLNKMAQLDKAARKARDGQESWDNVNILLYRIKGNPADKITEEKPVMSEEEAAAYHAELQQLRHEFPKWVDQVIYSGLYIRSAYADRVLQHLKKSAESFHSDYNLDNALAHMIALPLGNTKNSFNRLMILGENIHLIRKENIFLVQEYYQMPPSLLADVTPPDHIYISYNKSNQPVIKVGQQIKLQDFVSFIESVAGKKFQIRLGAHELGVKGLERKISDGFYNGKIHFHLEQTDPVTQIIHSYPVLLDLSAHTKGLSLSQLQSFYRSYLGQWISHDGREALRNVKE